MVGSTRKAGWHRLFLNRERVQDSFSGLVSLVRESVNRSEARLTGLLLALMLVPVAGLFVMIAVILVGLGAGTGILLWPRLGSGIRKLLNH
jgi:hypothetical protein